MDLNNKIQSNNHSKLNFFKEVKDIITNKLCQKEIKSGTESGENTAGVVQTVINLDCLRWQWEENDDRRQY